MKKAAVINDISGFGRCSLTAAIPILSVMGVTPCPVVSAVLTGQTGYSHYYSRDMTGMIPEYIEAWKTNGEHFDAIYSGYMTGAGQLLSFGKFLDAFCTEDTFLLVDPVMGDEGETYPIYSADFLNEMKKLAARADLITPNLTEACLLTDTPLLFARKQMTREELLDFAGSVGQKLLNLGGKKRDVVITGIKSRAAQDPVIYDLVMSGNMGRALGIPMGAGNFSGTGDIFASILCGGRLKGLELTDCVGLAQKFISRGIEEAGTEGCLEVEGIPFERNLSMLL